MGFADGALRLLPGWLEFELFGFTWSFNVFIGSIALIPLMYTATWLSIRSSSPGSPVTSGSTTCWTGPATPPPARRSA